VILASVTREPGLDATVDALRSRLPADLGARVEITIRDVPVVVGQGAFGGMWMRDNGFAACTSGWTVTKILGGTRGVTTAGHCTSIDQIDHPGHGLHNTFYQGGHEGQWGDVEWHTTGENEADDFYSDATTIRDVASVEPRANISVNEVVCVYGRASNVRNCSLEVRQVSIACGISNRIVQMNGAVTIGGDSGGGWSWVSTAFGGHKGLCDGFSSFSVADLFDEALGISVATT
jgi:hypothetical protein